LALILCHLQGKLNESNFLCARTVQINLLLANLIQSRNKFPAAINRACRANLLSMFVASFLVSSAEAKSRFSSVGVQ